MVMAAIDNGSKNWSNMIFLLMGKKENVLLITRVLPFLFSCSVTSLLSRFFDMMIVLYSVLFKNIIYILDYLNHLPM